MRFRYVDISTVRAINGGIAVVIDVMRAYTVAAWALHLGASKILLVDDVEHAVSLSATLPGSLLFKDGVQDPRFQLHNSATATALRGGVTRGLRGVTDQDVPMCLEVDRFDFAMKATASPSWLALTRVREPLT